MAELMDQLTGELVHELIVWLKSNSDPLLIVALCVVVIALRARVPWFMNFLAALSGSAIAWLKEERDKPIEEITAEYVDKNQNEVKRIIDGARRSKLDLIQKAIVMAVKLQRVGKYDKAIAKWSAIVEIAEDESIKSRAFYSHAYLIQKYNAKYDERDKDTVKKVIALYENSIELDPSEEASYGLERARQK